MNDKSKQAEVRSFRSSAEPQSSEVPQFKRSRKVWYIVDFGVRLDSDHLSVMLKYLRSISIFFGEYASE